MNKKILKDRNGKVRICVMGLDKKPLNPLAEAFMDFCKKEWGVKFVDVTPKKKAKK